jgi:hypothetical protein
MRSQMAGSMLVLALLWPDAGSAQMLMSPTPYPQVTAANAPWQVLGEPIAYGGALYYPVGPVVFFDGNVMTRSGMFEGVPLYQDGTLSPFTLIYVPIGGNLVRPYERPRDGALAGTVGTRTPSFPIQRDGEATSPFAPAYLVADTFQTITAPEPVIAPVASVEPPEGAGHVTIGSVVPAPGTRTGFWLMFDGARWYSAGAPVPFSPELFAQVGELQGFPVYRNKVGDADTIFIRTIKDGPLARYVRER